MFESTLLGILLSRLSFMKRSHCCAMTPFPDISFAFVVRVEIPTTVNSCPSTIFGVKLDTPKAEMVSLIARTPIATQYADIPAYPYIFILAILTHQLENRQIADG